MFYFSFAGVPTGARDAIRKVVLFMKSEMGSNYEASLLLMARMIMSVHFDKLSNEEKVKVPATFVVGDPISCKSKALDLVLAFTGHNESSSIGSKFFN